MSLVMLIIDSHGFAKFGMQFIVWTVDVLRALEVVLEGLTLSAFALVVGLLKSTVYRIVVVFESEDFVGVIVAGWLRFGRGFAQFGVAACGVLW